MSKIVQTYVELVVESSESEEKVFFSVISDTVASFTLRKPSSNAENFL